MVTSTLWLVVVDQGVDSELHTRKYFEISPNESIKYMANLVCQLLTNNRGSDSAKHTRLTLFIKKNKTGGEQ